MSDPNLLIYMEIPFNFRPNTSGKDRKGGTLSPDLQHFDIQRQNKTEK